MSLRRRNARTIEGILSRVHSWQLDKGVFFELNKAIGGACAELRNLQDLHPRLAIDVMEHQIKKNMLPHVPTSEQLTNRLF